MSSLNRLIRCTFGAGLALAAFSGIALAYGPLPSNHVPEIDAGTALSAMTLFSGGILMLTDRHRKK